MTAEMIKKTANRITAAVLIISIASASGLLVGGGKPGAAASSFSACAESPPRAQQPGPKSGPALTLEVVDMTGQSPVPVDMDGLPPVPGALVWVRSTGGRTHAWEGMTDEQGRFVVVAPDELTQGFDIMVAAAGYARYSLSTVFNGASVRRVMLERAEAIGGVVRDEQGRPIKGARVFPLVYRFSGVWSEIYASPNSERAIATTDNEGRWRSDALPTWMLARDQFGVLVTHPDHASCTPLTTAGDARAFSSVQVMKPGVAISGTVLSPFGHPVREDTVVVSQTPRDGPALRLTTDKDGRFRSSRCIDPDRPGLVLLVQASGLAWAVHPVAVKKPEIPLQVIRLSRRRPLEGRVVDTKGQPVEGAHVWFNRGAFGGLIEWSAETDANGRFVWHDAPTVGKVYLDVLKPTYTPAAETLDRPEKGEVTITVARADH
jgi:hypothetical protein